MERAFIVTGSFGHDGKFYSNLDELNEVLASSGVPIFGREFGWRIKMISPLGSYGYGSASEQDSPDHGFAALVVLSTEG